jgi:hypothetical protein
MKRKNKKRKRKGKKDMMPLVSVATICLNTAGGGASGSNPGNRPVLNHQA